MARPSTAASVSTTIGASFATLVAVAAILAWPTISECSSDPAGFGACVTDALAERGLLAPEKDTIERPVGPDVPTDPPLPISPAKPAGWLEATAAEIAPTRIAPVELVGAPAGRLNGQEAEADLPLSPLLLAPAAKVDATVAALSDAPETVTRLGGDLRALTATASAGPEDPVAKVALVGPVGAVAATALTSPAAIEPPQELVPAGPVGMLSATSPVEDADAQPLMVKPLPVKPAGTLAVAAPAEPPLRAEPLPVSPLPTKPRLPLPVQAVPAPVELTAEVAPLPIAVPVKRPAPPATVDRAPVIKYNPAFPNVVVLPPPATGANSSIQSWTID